MARPCPSTTNCWSTRPASSGTGRKNPGLLSVLEDFNEAMARAGALVIHYRAHFIRKLAEKAGAIQEEFSGGRETLALT